AIEAAFENGDFSLFEALLIVLSKPYEDQPGFAAGYRCAERGVGPDGRGSLWRNCDTKTGESARNVPQKVASTRSSGFGGS
ncbi:hypothetical protein ACC677_38075, partial [Rhizobium ruizarguesonis]